MGMTLGEKIIARAAGRDRVMPGEIVTCAVDLAMMHDSGGPRRIKPLLDRLGAKPWDPDRIVLVTDHYVPAFDEDSATILDIARKWAREQDIKAFYDMQGICHVVLPERGHLKPGMFAVGGDSHSPTGGAFGCFMIGIGATEMAGVVATGEIWVRVPRTLRIEWSGRLGRGVVAKDVMLHLCRNVGMNAANYRLIEYAGEAVTAMSMTERMTLANMSTELGAKTGIIAPDTKTVAAIEAAGADSPDPGDWQTDAGAEYEQAYRFNAGALAPQVAAPHSPDNSADVDEHAGVSFDIAYIGACTGAKLEDLRNAAEVLEGRKVAPGVRLMVAPASTRITAEAEADGTLRILTEAGATILPSGCGACAGYGGGIIGDGEVCLSSTARNFRGRMGSPGSMVYLGSPYTVAASAVAGHVCDPRELLD